MLGRRTNPSYVVYLGSICRVGVLLVHVLIWDRGAPSATTSAFGVTPAVSKAFRRSIALGGRGAVIPTQKYQRGLRDASGRALCHKQDIRW